MSYSKLMIIAVLGLTLLQPVAAQQEDVLDHPGYVDFTELNEIAGSEPNVEVSLKEPLLKLITNLLKNNEEEAAQFISTLIRVNVRVFDSSRLDTGRMAETMATVARRLDADSWERVVRVREGSDYVDVYFRLSEDGELIHGIAIMVAEPDETVLVNIVGDISPNDITAISERFDIDELAELEIETGN
jgi:hypothetical protein